MYFKRSLFLAREEVHWAKTMDYEGKFEKARIEVLETKIKVDSKNHDNEKEKIIKEKDQEIRSLEAKNESLLNELDMKGEKMRQLDFSNKNKL